MHRFTGKGDLPTSLNGILYEDFAALRGGRRAEEAKISRYIEGLSDGDLASTIHYRTFVRPEEIEQPLAPALDHFFSHQTHHRGQAHTLLSNFNDNEPTSSFDLIIYERETGQRDLRTPV
jgi:uncharacterized damage-inducible protein DinB